MKHFSLFLALTIALFSASAKTPLKIHRGDRDTVYKSQHTIVGVTTPGSTAKINGKSVHVYKTGTFGDEVSLNKGDNKIDIVVKNGNSTTKQTLNVFFKETSSTQKERNNPPHTITFETPQYFTTLDGAYMQYGDGGDRLGGSKMGFLDKDITVKAVAQKEDLYKIQLSQNRFAYINKEYLKETSDTTEQINTGSWSITNTGKTDCISISLPKRVPYSSWTQLDRTTIYFELYGATNNSNWITQRGELGMIEYVDYRHDESDVLKVVIKLKNKHSWGYSINYQGNSLKIDIKHTPALSLKDLTIGLDAGHGGNHPGAIGATGLTEKEVNLDMILGLKSLLEAKGAKVVLSRDKDTGPTIAERKKIFNEANIDLMISIHNNSGGSP